MPDTDHAPLPDARLTSSQGMSRFRMTVICLALLLEGMSSSSINVQVDAIRVDLGPTGAELQLVAGAFLVAYAGLLPAAGRLVDSWNRRTVFLAGITLFGVGCLACAGAGSAWVLAAGRFVQGAGAALSAPAALALITAGLPEGSARNRAVALYGAMGAVGFSLGLVLPGAVVTFLGWRASFLLFVPVVVLVLAVTWSVRVPRTPSWQRIDLLGALLLTATLVVTMHGIGGVATLSVPVLVGHAVVVGVLMVSLVLRGGVAGFPSTVVRAPRVAAACVGMAGVFGGVVASMYVLSLGLAARLGADAFVVGLAILPQPVAFSLLAGTGARLVTRYGPGRTFAGGVVLLTVSIGYLGLAGASAPTAVAVLPAMAGVGAALALCFPSASIAAIDAAPVEFRGTTAGLLTTAQNVGGAAGLALVTALAVVPGHANQTGLRAGMLVSAAMVLVGGLAAAAVARSSSSRRHAA